VDWQKWYTTHSWPIVHIVQPNLAPNVPMAVEKPALIAPQGKSRPRLLVFAFIVIRANRREAVEIGLPLGTLEH